MRSEMRQSLRLALLAISFLNLGAAVPFGISEISVGAESSPNASEYVLSALFAALAVASVVGMVYLTSIVAEVAFASGALWLVTDAYIFVDEGIDVKARFGLGLIFGGIAVGCFSLWQQIRAATT